MKWMRVWLCEDEGVPSSKWKVLIEGLWRTTLSQREEGAEELRRKICLFTHHVLVSCGQLYDGRPQWCILWNGQSKLGLVKDWSVLVPDYCDRNCGVTDLIGVGSIVGDHTNLSQNNNNSISSSNANTIIYTMTRQQKKTFRLSLLRAIVTITLMIIQMANTNNVDNHSILFLK